MTEAKQLTIAALAAQLDTDPRTLRGFLREHDLGVGRGQRYAWPSLDSAPVKRIVKAWGAAQDAHARAHRDADAKDGAPRADVQERAA